MGGEIIIIGAGIAGLAAGCYAQMNGYSTEIYEVHNLPGGLCTAWDRNGYTFDGCLHWVTGSAPDDWFYPLWGELGAVQHVTFVNHGEYCRYIDRDGKVFVLYTDVDRLEQHLIEVSPEDSVVSKDLCNLIRRFKKFKPTVSKAVELMNALDYMRMLPQMGLLKDWQAYGKITMGAFASRFRSPYIREMFSSVWNPDIPMSLFLSTMAWYSNQTAGFPLGGSLEFVRGIEKRYLDLGGTIHYGQGVDSVIVEGNRARGIRLADGAEHRAETVISAADGFATIFKMLAGKYTTKTIDEWYSKMAPFPPYVQVSLGVNRDMSRESQRYFYKLAKPITVGGTEIPAVIVNNYAFDRSLAPEGKCALTVQFFSEYGYWADIYKDRTKYRAEKKMIADAIVAELDQLFPGLREQVEVIDVATPNTYVRYTGTWQGATMGWLPSPLNFGKEIGKSLPGLDNFYMVGQWLVPGGGVPTAAKTSRDMIQIMCKRDGKRFTTTTPQN